MCYSADASLETLIINHISSSILYYTYDRTLGMVFLFVGFMQFWDYTFWTNPGRNWVNYWSTKLAMLTNHILPIIFPVCLYIYNNTNFYWFDIYLILLYIVSIFIYSIKAWNKIDYTIVSKKSYPGLLWEWNTLSGKEFVYSLYIFIFISIFYSYYPYPLNIIFIISTILTYILSFYKYHKLFSTGRFWCHLNAYLPIYIIILYMFYFKFKIKQIETM